MENQDVFSYIKTEETNFKTARVPLTRSKDWNMAEHIERCTNVANGWFHQGKNDDTRPYDDIVTPVINVAFRSEGFDVKDIVPYVDDLHKSYLSFFIKKYQPQWARKHKLDDFIDEVVETSIIYDLVLVKNLNNELPQVVDLKKIAFCDQTDVMAGPICIKHQYTVAEINEYRGIWDDDAIDVAIALAKQELVVSTAGNQVTKVPGKYIEVYELRGNLPESWLKQGGNNNKYVPQLHVVCYYKDSTKDEKVGLTLFKGKDKKLSQNFKALKIDKVRSKGRACGKSIVESLFQAQVWNNYSGIKLKMMLDSAITLFQTDSEEFKNKKLTELKNNTIIGHETNKPITKVEGTLQNLPAFTGYQDKMRSDARTLGSASDPQLGNSPTSGTPFKLQDLVVQQGQGLHEYRQGKVATFFADELYADWILGYMVDDLDNMDSFSEELTLAEMEEVANTIATNRAEMEVAEVMFSNKRVSPQQKEELITFAKEKFMKGGTRGFFRELKDAFKELPTKVFVNIKGKQKYMSQNADKISNLITNILANPGAIAQIPGVGNLYNELLEESGFSPIDFSKITVPPVEQTEDPKAPVAQPVA